MLLCGIAMGQGQLTISTTYIVYTCLITDCPIAGQQRSNCAASCNITCSNYLTTICPPPMCVVNGCQCPSSYVINEMTNACVPMEDCSRGELPLTFQ